MKVKLQQGFPVFAVEFTPNKPRFIVAGGGGNTRAGVKNTAILFNLDEQDSTILSSECVNEECHVEFPRNEDAVMSLCVHPHEKVAIFSVNSSEEDIIQGKNDNCRIYGLDTQDQKFEFISRFSSLDSTDSMHHQKTILFSPDGNLLLTSNTLGVLTVWHWPLLKHVFAPFNPGNEISNACFDGSSQYIGLVTRQKCMILNGKNGNIEWKIETPIVSNVQCEFRSLQFGSGPSESHLFVICNAVSRKKAFLVRYVRVQDDYKSWKLQQSKWIARKPITAFRVSMDGELLGLGCADLSVFILKSCNLQPIIKVDDAHGFPVTCLSFSPSSKTLISGSADGTCLLVQIPPPSKPFSSWILILILFLILSCLVLLYMNVYNDVQDL